MYARMLCTTQGLLSAKALAELYTNGSALVVSQSEPHPIRSDTSPILSPPQRIAEKHAKMKAALAEQQAAEAAEAAKREEQVVLKDQHKAAVEAWKKHHKVCGMCPLSVRCKMRVYWRAQICALKEQTCKKCWTV